MPEQSNKAASLPIKPEQPPSSCKKYACQMRQVTRVSDRHIFLLIR